MAYVTLCRNKAIRCIWDAIADASSMSFTVIRSGCSPTSVSRWKTEEGISIKATNAIGTPIRSDRIRFFPKAILTHARMITASKAPREAVFNI